MVSNGILTTFRTLLALISGIFAWSVFSLIACTWSDPSAAEQGAVIRAVACFATGTVLLSWIAWGTSAARRRVREIGDRIHDVGGAYIDNSTDLDRADWREAIRHLLISPIPEIVWVDFSNAPVSDSDLTFLPQLRHLRSINLSQTAITAETLTVLPQLPRLQVLLLADTALGDEACEPISRCLRLRRVDLNKTSITDGGLKELRTLRHLRILSLDRTLVSDAALLEFEDHHPFLRRSVYQRADSCRS